MEVVVQRVAEHLHVGYKVRYTCRETSKQFSTLTIEYCIACSVLYRDYTHPNCVLQSYRWDGLNFENGSFVSYPGVCLEITPLMYASMDEATSICV